MMNKTKTWGCAIILSHVGILCCFSALGVTELSGPVILSIDSHLGPEYPANIQLTSSGDVYIAGLSPLRVLNDLTVDAGGDLTVATALDVTGDATILTHNGNVLLSHSLQSGGTVQIVTNGVQGSINVRDQIAADGLSVEAIGLNGMIEFSHPLTSRGDAAIVSATGPIVLGSEIPVAAAGTITVNSGSTIEVSKGFSGFPSGSAIQGAITVTSSTKVDKTGQTTNAAGGNVSLTANAGIHAINSQRLDSVPGGSNAMATSVAFAPDLESFWPHPDAPIIALSDLEAINVVGDALLRINGPVDQLSVTADGQVRFVTVVPEPSSLLIVAVGLVVVVRGGIKKTPGPGLL